jgi:hypothetical protein
MNMTRMIVDKDGGALESSDLVGFNATLMFPPRNVRDYSVFEEVDQVSLGTSTEWVREGVG